jgi:hypothetical protein
MPKALQLACSRRSAHRGFRGRCLAPASFAVCLLAPLRLEAQPTIGADVAYALPLEDDLDSGASFGARIGHQFDGHSAAITPELGFNYVSLSGGLEPRVYRGMAGVRFGVGKVVRPGAFAHGGFGHVKLDAPSGTGESSYTAFTFDAGAFLDVTLVPYVTFGAHLAYNRVDDTDDFESVRWASFGGHVAVIFK